MEEVKDIHKSQCRQKPAESEKQGNGKLNFRNKVFLSWRRKHCCECQKECYSKWRKRLLNGQHLFHCLAPLLWLEC